MMKAIITVGISGSGKSTFAESLVSSGHDWAESNRDDIRFDTILEAEVRDWSKYKFSKANENRVTQLQKDGWQFCAALGLNLIVSDTNLNKGRREELVRTLEGLGYEVEIKDFPISWEEACARDSLRHNGVGKAVLYKQWLQWNEYIGRKKYVRDESKPKAILVDIDGTCAHMNGRGPFEWDRVGEDTPDFLVRHLIRSFHPTHKTIFMSGRDACCRSETLLWLDGHSFYTGCGHSLFMRPEGDMRKDSVIKEELFWKHVADNYCVDLVIDDRPQVVRMWHDLGLRVLAVGDQRNEF